MASVSLELVAKSYPNGYQAVTDFSVDIKDKEFMILVGPSGCGKSTTMRMIAGLEDVSSGTIQIGDQVVNNLPPKARDIAMVFQDYALYPHMTVAENMSLSLRLQKVKPAEIKERVKETAAILDLTEVLDRKPKELSGGQRQRVALGRAIVRTPKVFMFDEPLSNLDPKLRGYMRVELKKLHQRLQTTMIYVTHDQVEAMTLGDRIIVMDARRIQQLDTPINIYNRPANKFVASFIGAPPMNFFRCAVQNDSGELLLKGNGLKLSIPTGHRLHEKLANSFTGAPEIDLGIRAEDMRVRLRSEETGPVGFSQAVLEVKEPIAPEVYLHMKTENQAFVVREEGLIAEKISVGDELFISIDLDKVHLFSVTDGKAIE